MYVVWYPAHTPLSMPTIHLNHIALFPCLALVMPFSRDTLTELSMTLTRLSGAKSLRNALVAQLLGEWVASSPLAKADGRRPRRWATSPGGGGGAKRIHSITYGGGGTARKKNPTPMCKKVSQPQFFPKGCFFTLCKRSLHNALRTANIPYFTGTNLVAVHIPVGPKFSHHKARMLAVGPQEFWLGVQLLKMTIPFFQE